ncbi:MULTISPECIES: endolytic transglycosylase MltG [unclassified Streptomyces]|uniref:endolytic transglycosylase MltG n=1 Tax=unclassified Streptomyces TaxID=2593676 RepID=UPI002E8126B1|nr:endolytic transglycosylase MltG [Streptomyces sp. NBC_00589]WTI40712.1 endolytic transglycosylase MltG [Streptomyces sp. NBC_00775]WUB25603.1 endolytic transglycosylase MltG [Streptomyces sp. NBC_00589]
MTEYGRGPGSEPWHPEDPLYGDGGWGGQAADGQSAYDGGQPQHYPQQPQQQQQAQAQYGEWAAGQQGAYGQNQQQYVDQGQQQYHGQGQQQFHDQNQQHFPGQGHPQQYADQTQHPYNGQGQQQYVDQGQQQYGGQGQQQYNDGGWNTGTHTHVPYAADPADPYAGQYSGEQPDYYGTPDAYPPPEPPARRRAEPEPQTDWDPGPDQGEHAFFAGGGDDDDDFDDDDPKSGRGRGDRRGKGAGKGKKRRSGCACLVVVLVFGGGLGGVGYFGYQFYQKRFGPAPDYTGSGTGEAVTVEIPSGAGGYAIGQALKDAGVIKSVDAFVSAQKNNPDGDKIQAGAYLLKQEMSAANAVKLMLDPKSQNNVVVYPGQRNSKVYTLIDAKLQLPGGTTKKVALKEYKSLGLPDWAKTSSDVKDPLEGFLYPATYPAAKGMKPEDVLKKMVEQASQKYATLDLKAKAKDLNLDNPLQVITVASLVQAEGKTHDDFRKMAEVIYNRLKPTNTETNQLLQFDSTFNYLKGQSKIHISESEINTNKSPYNTYTRKGLPPGPIGNPGDDALKATLNPTDDGWIYFVATDGESNTEFAKTYAEFQRLKEKFNDSSGN